MSQEWILGIYTDPLESICGKGKEVEGRVPDPNDENKTYSEMEEGDTIQFELRDGDGDPELVDLKFTVTYVTHYETIRAMLESEGLERVLPDVDTIDEGVERYRSFAGYGRRAKEHGIYAIGIKQVTE
jgi:ASC-1-like (ASCH) protein